MEKVNLDIYFYDLSRKLLQYTQDKRMYSPNNVRRLIISPDLIAMQPHIYKGVPTGNQLKGCRTLKVDGQRLMTGQTLPTYRPALESLSDPVHRLIEEVVICSRGHNNASLDYRELDYQTMLKGYEGVAESDMKRIKNRFKRLCSFIIYEGYIDDFYKHAMLEAKNGTSLLMNNDWVKSNCNVISFDNKDWYRQTKGTAHTYILDATNSPLMTHLRGIGDKIEKSDKENKKKEYVEEKTKTVKEKMFKELRTLKYLLDCCGILFQKYRSEGTLTDKEIFTIHGCSLNDVFTPEEKKRYRLNGFYTLTKKKGGISSAIQDNIKEIKKTCGIIYYSLYEYMIEVLKSYPELTQNYIMKNIDRRIFTPPNQEKEIGGIEFENASMPVSVANILTILSTFYINDNNMTKERWTECIQKCLKL